MRRGRRGPDSNISCAVQLRGIIVETGGTLLGPPGDETPKGQWGSQDGMGARPSVRWKPPPLRVVRMGAGER